MEKLFKALVAFDNFLTTDKMWTMIFYVGAGLVIYGGVLLTYTFVVGFNNILGL